MNKRELLSYLIENNTSFSLAEVLIGSGVAILLAFFQFFVYKKTFDGVKYSKTFNITLIMTTIITTMVMMIIGSNLALSLGMVGALSIIRFRTAVKDAKDIAFIFWSVAIGLACGSGIYVIGIVGSLVIAVILFLMCNGKASEDLYLLTVQMHPESDAAEVERYLAANLRQCELKISSTKPDAADATYEVRLKSKSARTLCAELGELDAVQSVNIVQYEGVAR